MSSERSVGQGRTEDPGMWNTRHEPCDQTTLLLMYNQGLIKAMMSQTLLSLKIVGLHPVIPDKKMFQDALDDFWGGDESEESVSHVKEHFANLYILEIEIDPPNAVFDWAEITQLCTDKLGDCWQVPWDERAIDDVGRRWAFFFHCLDLSRPLRTPLGEIVLPTPTPLPEHLHSLEYQLP